MSGGEGRAEAAVQAGLRIAGLESAALEVERAAHAAAARVVKAAPAAIDRSAGAAWFPLVPAGRLCPERTGDPGPHCTERPSALSSTLPQVARSVRRRLDQSPD